MSYKILSIKNASAIFLATVLVLGTITLSSTPSFMKDVQAQQDYRTNSYDSEYGMDNDYKDRYGKDIYESQYSSYGKDNYKSKDNVIVKKINCNNVNVNENGLELNGLPPFLVNLLASDGQDGYGDASYYGNSERSYGSGQSDAGKDFKFVCINNNNNTVVVVNETTPEPLEPLTCVECFREFLTPSEIAAVEEFTEFTIEEFCPILDADPITESGFRFFLETEIDVEPFEINNIVECLIESGIEFEPEPPQP